MDSHDRQTADLLIRPCRGADEYPMLVEIWRSAVRATHDFLDEADFARIESRLAADYFPAVALTVAERGAEVVGFAGVAEGNLEMLFITDEARGAGIGSALLAEAIAHYGVNTVDVNEQNPAAVGFYTSRGFVQVGRSELDGDGRPYPLLHLALRS
ncbi:GNAT family N-acetyltransferase [Leucobacter sp. gxy201]|uniref:GNAT family N-acetyltransferase n=1 Tax=Leucobacter sp. gxy201 TaxID=2957200 RepID=UPI003DA043E4